MLDLRTVCFPPIRGGQTYQAPRLSPMSRPHTAAQPSTTAAAQRNTIVAAPVYYEHTNANAPTPRLNPTPYGIPIPYAGPFPPHGTPPPAPFPAPFYPMGPPPAFPPVMPPGAFPGPPEYLHLHPPPPPGVPGTYPGTPFPHFGKQISAMRIVNSFFSWKRTPPAS